MNIIINIENYEYKELSEAKKIKILNNILGLITKFFNNKKITISFEKNKI